MIVSYTNAAGEEARARAFFVDVLGMAEIAKPPRSPPAAGPGSEQAGVEGGFRPARKAHPGILVTDLDSLAARLTATGVTTDWDDGFPAHRRFYASDPFGNRLEFLQPDG